MNIKAVLSRAEHDTPEMPEKVSLIPNARKIDPKDLCLFVLSLGECNVV